jgi:ricin-type beta-trefoil lectin protein
MPATDSHTTARRCLGLLAATVLAVLPATVGARAAFADASGPIRGPGASGKCIDVAGDDTGTTGAPVQVWDCLGVADQQWTVGSDQTIRTLGKCLDIDGYGTANFAKIHLWDCHGGTNQQWQTRADGSILNPASGRCLDTPNGATANGVQLQLYDCNGQWPQVWQAPGGTGGGQFGNTVLHPDKLGVYAIPDLPYADPGRTLASLRRLHDLLPSAWLRWDNETGHWRDTPAAVESFIAQADQASLPMIISACCVDGYDNWWARGGSQPTVSIGQIADGPYLSFAARMQDTYPHVRYVETINEPDTAWFVADPDNTGAWNHYLDRLTAAVGGNTDRLLGPATAFRGSQIWNNTVARPAFQHLSYHTYGGWQSLSEVAGKADTWVTEYGDSNVPDTVSRSPAYLLTDLWHAEAAGKLSGTIRQLFYVDLQHMINAGSTEGDHYGFSGQLRALAAYQALATVSTRAYLDPAHDDLAAADNGNGQFAALVWNNTDGTASGQTRTVANTSLKAGTPLNTLTVSNRDSGAAQCVPLAAQGRVGVTVAGGTTTIHLNAVDPRAAVLVTTAPCTDTAS